MQELIDKVESLTSLPDHYLVQAKALNHPYFAGFLAAGALLKPLLTAQEFAYWCAEKMLLKPQPFREKTFVQYAVETAVATYFGARFPLGFAVEKRVNPANDKDVDCVFQDGGFTYNVEVKCSDFIAKEEIDSLDAFKYETIGRLPDRGAEARRVLEVALNEGLAKRGEAAKPHVTSKNMDNNLKGFLESAHEKFGSSADEQTVNVLVVGCDDAEDLQRWFNYLWASEGLFTDASFADRTRYRNVDLVVLTNQYFKHNKVLTKRVTDSWDLGDGFNHISVNPRRLQTKAAGIAHFKNLLPNFSSALAAYRVPGPAPDYVKDARRIVYFIKDYLERQQGRYLFEAAQTAQA